MMVCQEFKEKWDQLDQQDLKVYKVSLVHPEQKDLKEAKVQLVLKVLVETKVFKEFKAKWDQQDLKEKQDLEE
jgi:hypothetical protein